MSDIYVPIPHPERPYYEGFFAVQFVAAGVLISPITQEQYYALENTVAEVNIPLNLRDEDYCMIAMLIDLPNDQIAIAEILQLQEIVADVVGDQRDHFKRVG